MDYCLWSRALIFDLIVAFKKHECLWQTHSRYYYNRGAHKEAYEDLVNLVQDDFPNADVQFVKKKIKNLRCAFRKEHKKQKMAKRGGTNYVPRLWYFDLLLFTVNENNLATNPPPKDRSDDESHQ